MICFDYNYRCIDVFIKLVKEELILITLFHKQITENIFIQDKCTLKSFHIEILECFRADERKIKGNEGFLETETSFNWFPLRYRSSTIKGASI